MSTRDAAFTERANQYRPQTRGEMRRAVLDLLADGHCDYSISAALQVAVEEIRRLAAAEESDLQ